MIALSILRPFSWLQRPFSCRGPKSQSKTVHIADFGWQTREVKWHGLAEIVMSLKVKTKHSLWYCYKELRLFLEQANFCSLICQTFDFRFSVFEEDAAKSGCITSVRRSETFHMRCSFQSGEMVGKIASRVFWARAVLFKMVVTALVL